MSQHQLAYPGVTGGLPRLEGCHVAYPAAIVPLPLQRRFAEEEVYTDDVLGPVARAGIA
jgi:hypothetical protein